MLRRILTAFTLIAIALSALGQKTTFLIDRIEVRNAQHVAPEVIVAETLLREGKEYSEDDVRLAVARLNRLPFLLSADSTLENGPADGRRILVLNVTETKRFSFLLGARGIVLDDHRSTIDYDYDRPAESNDALDLRWFAGDRGVVHFAMAVRRGRQAFKSRYTAWEIGYTRYDLFGTRVFATINVRTPVDSVNEGRFTPELIAGVPLTATQTVTIDYLDTSFIRETRKILGTDFDLLHAERVISLAWTYDTTDQPFVPTRGTLVRVAPLHVMTDRASFSSVPRSPSLEPNAEHANTNGIDFAALRYWRLSDVQSVSGGIFGGWADLEDRQNSPSRSSTAHRSPTYEIAQIGYSRELRNGRSKSGASRLELEGRFVMGQQDAARDHERSLEASASWVRRSVWSTLRLSAGYERKE